MDPVIEIQDMSCRFERVEAVRNLTLTVPSGSIYAFLGANGAGKTTTIKTLLNLIKPNSGSARIFGVDSTRLDPSELMKIGYVSENQKLPEQLTVKQLVDYCSSLYPTWDKSLCQRLTEKFALPADRPMKHFSRGMKIKAALLVSLAYRPQLLLMDEPFSGLDPVVREDLVEGILEMSEQENWTVFISSHDIDEVDRLSDHVGIINNGSLTLSESSDKLRARFRRVDAILDGGMSPLPTQFKEVLLPEVSGSSIRWIESHYTSDEVLGAKIKAWFPDCRAWTATPLTLREIFIAITRAHSATTPSTL